jgi:deoxyribodipyrimidine photo-lyase
MLAESPPFKNPAYQQATLAQSGIDVFDHWAKELKSEGYLHNHARLWLSSLWIHTLKLPWQWGAAWFLEHLFDGDPASNTLSWRWVAGLHTKGKAYMASAENIAKFTNRRLSPILPTVSASDMTDNVDHPLIEPQLAPPLSECSIKANDGLILLGDDLSVDTLKELASRPLRAIAFVPSDTIGRFFAWQDQVRVFHNQALKDALYRAKKIWPMADFQVVPAEASGSTQLFMDWNSMGINRILVPAPHQGPYRDLWQSLIPSLSQFQITPFSRRYDLELLPLGKKGFFDFWQKRPPWQRLCQEEIFHQG